VIDQMRLKAGYWLRERHKSQVAEAESLMKEGRRAKAIEK
jgi:hypothetical protein